MSSDRNAASDVVIDAEGLSKRYTIRHKNLRSEGLRHSIQHLATAPFRWLARRNRPASADVPAGAEGPAVTEAFYALKGVSFQVRQGEVLGIVGRNGAGKSTLLKLLSRITEPTEGRVRIIGRVASLLEVGTGFHPELSGRENVFLNGAVLGMTRREIARKFDEIVAFAGVERFLDTPVKRYSSGMYVRLAFAVAAHLEPEILLVDEVLAVGDAEFQKKCLGKMKDVTRHGRTVVFVSHNMAAVRNLCTRTISLDKGSVVADGPTIEVVSRYLQQDYTARAAIVGDELTRRVQRDSWGRGGDGVLYCREVALLDADGQSRDQFSSDEEITIAVTYECKGSHHDFRLVVTIVDDDNLKILTTQTADDALNPTYQLNAGVYVSRCTIPANLFGERRFYISLRLVLPHIEELAIERILGFDVTFSGYNNVQYLSYKESFLRPQASWRTEHLATPIAASLAGQTVA